MTAIGAGSLLYKRSALGPAGLGLVVLLPVAAFVIAAARFPRFRGEVDSIALPWLIGVHTVRLLGVMFLILQAEGRLPAPFAPAAG